MKVLKKIGVLTMVIIMSIVMVLPAMADSIIDPSATGSITLHKYAIEEGMELILNADGTVLDPSTVITDDGVRLQDLHPLSDVEFTVVRVRDTDTDPETAAALTGKDAYSKTLSTGTNGTVVFSDLALGTYLVSEVTNQSISEAVAPFLVSVPMTNPAGNGWIYDVHVYPKNMLAGAPIIDKFVSELGNKNDGYKLSDMITWFITSEIPESGISDAHKYQIHDDLHEYLKYVDGSVSLYLIGDDGPVALSFNTHYTFTPRGNGFDITLTSSGQAFIDDTIAATASPDKLLYVEYATTLEIPEDELEANLGKAISSNAYDTYVNAAGVPFSDSVDLLPEVHTGGINLLKLDGNDNTILLSGAKFKIYPSETDAKEGTNAVLTPFGSEEWEVVTLTDGTASFYGLAYGAKATAADGTSDYWIVETQAPNNGNDRYNLLKSPMKITVDAASHLQENVINVENYKGFILPVTGGIGTAIFTIMGIIFIAASVFVFYMSNKKKNMNVVKEVKAEK